MPHERGPGPDEEGLPQEGASDGRSRRQMDMLDDTLPVPAHRSDRTVELERRIVTARLVVVAGECVGTSATFTDTLVVGRSSDCDFTVPAPDISRRHVRLERAGPATFTVTDLGSANGTSVAGLPLASDSPMVLTLGDRIQLGRHTAVVFVKQDEVEEQLIAQQKMQAIGRLASGVAHDFNNLLLVMSACVEHLELVGDARLSDPEVQGTLADIRLAVEHAGGLTGQLLSFARKGSRRREAVNVGKLLEETVRLLRRTSGKLDVSVQNPDVMLVQGDPEQLHQVVMNLCLNAADAMQGQGALHLECRGANFAELDRASVSPRLQYVTLRISDEGCGMDAETLQHLFEPFFTRKAGGRGTGLGLATAYGIIKEHGGDVLVDSTEGLGTTFRVLLPLGAHGSEPVRERSNSLSNLAERVLVVDDRELVLRSTRRLLERSGIDVEAVLTGGEAIERVADDPGGFDACLLDLNLGDTSGEDVLSRLKQLAPGLRVVVTSGFLDADTTLRLEGLGADGLLDKPFTRMKLIRALSST